MSEKEIEIRIECGGVTRQYGKVLINEGEEVESTGLYKEVSKIAESCAHEDASNKCKVNVVDVNNSDYYNDILTPCGSSISSIRKIEEEQGDPVNNSV